MKTEKEKVILRPLYGNSEEDKVILRPDFGNSEEITYAELVEKKKKEEEAAVDEVEEHEHEHEEEDGEAHEEEEEDEEEEGHAEEGEHDHEEGDDDYTEARKSGAISMKEKIWAREGDNVNIDCRTSFGYKGKSFALVPSFLSIVFSELGTYSFKIRILYPQDNSSEKGPQLKSVSSSPFFNTNQISFIKVVIPYFRRVRLTTPETERNCNRSSCRRHPI